MNREGRGKERILKEEGRSKELGGMELRAESKSKEHKKLKPEGCGARKLTEDPPTPFN